MRRPTVIRKKAQNPRKNNAEQFVRKQNNV